MKRENSLSLHLSSSSSRRADEGQKQRCFDREEEKNELHKTRAKDLVQLKERKTKIKCCNDSLFCSFNSESCSFIPVRIGLSGEMFEWNDFATPFVQCVFGLLYISVAFVTKFQWFFLSDFGNDALPRVCVCVCVYRTQSFCFSFSFG